MSPLQSLATLALLAIGAGAAGLIAQEITEYLARGRRQDDE